MRRLDYIVLRLGPLWVTGEPALSAKSAEILAAGQQFVNVTLVAGVKDDGVARRIKHAVNGNGGFNHTEIWAKVAAGSRYRINQVFSNLLGELKKFGSAKSIQISWIGDSR